MTYHFLHQLSLSLILTHLRLHHLSQTISFINQPTRKIQTRKMKKVSDQDPICRRLPITKTKKNANSPKQITFPPNNTMYRFTRSRSNRTYWKRFRGWFCYAIETFCSVLSHESKIETKTKERLGLLVSEGKEREEEKGEEGKERERRARKKDKKGGREKTVYFLHRGHLTQISLSPTFDQWNTSCTS